MAEFKTLLFDADGTLWDFDASAMKSLEILFQRRGYVYSPHVFERYDTINQSLWQEYEKGNLSRDRVLVDRFTILFGELGIDEKGERFENDFREELEKNPIWMDGAEEILSWLRPNYAMYIVTNGVASTQWKRIAGTGLDRYVDGFFISEEIGAQKPQQAFFDHCLAHIRPCKRSEILLIGDSLSADIQGAINAGIHSCWFNHAGKSPGSNVHPDYEIRKLADLRGILQPVTG